MFLMLCLMLDGLILFHKGDFLLHEVLLGCFKGGVAICIANDVIVIASLKNEKILFYFFILSMLFLLVVVEYINRVH